MPGLYLHIPFCKQACHYCNFHFSTTLRQKPALVAAILQELDLQQDYLRGETLSSIYLGGGTPSLLDLAELQQILDKVYALFPVNPDAEVTLEANPDDLTPEKLYALRTHTPINRLSIGIQSFQDTDLRWMNRAHSAAEARRCLEDALAAGFQDLTIDLIYGAPTTTDAAWAENLKIALDLGIPHLSSYCLTVEEGTALAHFVRKGKSPEVNEDTANRQFLYLLDRMEEAGFVHYEISNFALPGHFARHNSSYWKGEPYLGVGPSAHSFDLVSRQWNVANNARYIRALEVGTVPFEREVLTRAQQYNEFVMTGLRTVWGCEKARIRAFGEPFTSFLEDEIRSHIREGRISETATHYTLTRAGKLLADRIAADLFWVD
ncbi:MAG: radical SAM family heme chaperone HemW [Bacteroidetes bacterium]|nr:MAG: radical SAM family heme chaperone HemW [Bacteroidota bacterium]